MNMPEELLPVVEWWEKDGKQTVAILVVAGIAAAGWFGVKSWRAARVAAASDALISEGSAEDLAKAASDYSGTPAGASLKMRQAQAFFEAERYDEALVAYEDMAKNGAPDGFGDVPSVGIAQCLEAQGKTAEALKAFAAFAEDKPTSFLALTAQIGAARCEAALGDRDKALARLAAAKEKAGDDASAKARIEDAEDLVKRWEKREGVSLFDAANAVAKKLSEEADGAAAPAAEPAPAAAPAESAPAVPAAEPAATEQQSAE